MWCMPCLCLMSLHKGVQTQALSLRLWATVYIAMGQGDIKEITSAPMYPTHSHVQQQVITTQKHINRHFPCVSGKLLVTWQWVREMSRGLLLPHVPNLQPCNVQDASDTEFRAWVAVGVRQSK